MCYVYEQVNSANDDPVCHPADYLIYSYIVICIIILYLPYCYTTKSSVPVHKRFVIIKTCTPITHIPIRAFHSGVGTIGYYDRRPYTTALPQVH